MKINQSQPFVCDLAEIVDFFEFIDSFQTKSCRTDRSLP
ncbi:hypothetical protein GP2143_10267 [marine gamma proteobacterium HTCC2143]|uniref:Uncharacterized protein n=1 Tax=marine gamma proteobacterium HTCC2143 TaxID=247633 RepID=A0YDU0_9GAMM|nr:hypothetical protein GP2143_10267 [marine gamma proteobacterium HTCC2143]